MYVGGARAKAMDDEIMWSFIPNSSEWILMARMRVDKLDITGTNHKYLL